MKTPALAFALVSLYAAAALAQPAAAPAEPKEQAVKALKPEEADKLINERKDVIVLDVRTPEEYTEGHIPGAKNLSFIDLDFKERLKEFEGKPVIVHCAAGSRSTKAVNVMKFRNFPELYHLETGIKGWKEAGKTVVKSPAELK
jgi:phage shock protein E